MRGAGGVDRREVWAGRGAPGGGRLRSRWGCGFGGAGSSVEGPGGVWVRRLPGGEAGCHPQSVQPLTPPNGRFHAVCPPIILATVGFRSCLGAGRGAGSGGVECFVGTVTFAGQVACWGDRGRVGGRAVRRGGNRIPRLAVSPPQGALWWSVPHNPSNGRFSVVPSLREGVGVGWGGILRGARDSCRARALVGGPGAGRRKGRAAGRKPHPPPRRPPPRAALWRSVPL